MSVYSNYSYSGSSGISGSSGTSGTTGISYSEYIAENTDGQYFIPITFPDDEDSE
jgi:hypothetical protein